MIIYKQNIDWVRILSILIFTLIFSTVNCCDIESIFADNKLGVFYSAKNSEKIKSIYRSSSEIYSNFRNCSANELKDRIKNFSPGKKNIENIIFYVAIARRAAFLAKGFAPYPTQLVSLICCLDDSLCQERGLLLQVKTGEGKSLITAMIAACRALQGLHVDIISSSTPLSQRDFDDYASFYKQLGISAAILPETMSSKRIAYRDNLILYGDLGTFQGDYLRDGYMAYKIRANRPFNILLLDEADSILCDRAKYVTQVTSPSPAMANLFPILTHMWFMWGNFQNEGYSGNALEAAVLTNIRALIEGNIKVDGQSTNIINIPKYLKQFVNLQLPAWLNALKTACHLQKDVDYILHKNGIICPVDAKYTGVVELNMIWGNGVHQFLQIKHSYKMVPESFSGPYLSTPAFLNFYENGLIYGLTGTLGDGDTKEFYQELYKLDYCIIPKHAGLPSKELALIECSDSKKWATEIISEIKAMDDANRGTLVISATIKENSFLYKNAQELFPEIPMREYSRSDRDSEVLKAPLHAKGEVIFATNLAGRGTDIEIPTSMVQGMHVLVTFVPDNERVEAQAFGRTARKKAKGTARIIYNQEDNVNLLGYDNCKAARNLLEANRLASLRKEIFQLKLYDGLFAKICKTYALIRKKYSQDKEIMEQLNELWGIQYWRLTNLTSHLRWELLEKAQAELVFDILSDPIDDSNALFYSIACCLRNKEEFFSVSDLKKRVYQTLDVKSRNELITNYGDTRQSPFADDTLESSNAQTLIRTISSIIQRTLIVLNESGNSYICEIANSKEPIHIFISDVRNSRRVNDFCILSDIGWGEITRPISPSLQAAMGVNVIPDYIPISYTSVNIDWDYLSPDVKCEGTSNYKNSFTKQELEQIIFHTDNLDLYVSAELLKNHHNCYVSIVECFLQRIRHKLFCDDNLEIVRPIDVRSFFVNEGYLCQYAVRKNDRNILSDSLIKGGFLYFAALYNKAKLSVREGYIIDAQQDLKKSLALTEEFLNPWLTIFVLLQKEGYGNELSSPFYEQLRSKIAFVDLLRSSINQNINILEKNQKTKGNFAITEGNYIEDSIPKSEQDDSGIKGLDNAECHYWHTICLGNLYGIEFLPTPPSVWNYIGVFMLGVSQTVLGALATCTGYGAYFAKDFIIQGFSDIWQSLKSGFTGEIIDWGSYWLGKGINYGIAIVSAGVCKCMSFIKGGANVASAANTARQSVKEVLVAGVKQVAVGQVISSAASFITDKVLENFLDDIKNKVSTRIDSIMSQRNFAYDLEKSIKISKMKGDKQEKLSTIIFTKDWLGREAAGVWIKSLSNLVNTSMDKVHSIVGTVTRITLAGKDLANLINFLDKYISALKEEELEINTPTLFDLFFIRYKKYSVCPLVDENTIKDWFTNTVCTLCKDKKYYIASSWCFYDHIQESTQETLHKNIRLPIASLDKIRSASTEQMKEIYRILSDITYAVFEYELYTRDTDIGFVRNYIIQILMSAMNGQIQSLTTPWVKSGLHGIYSIIQTEFFKEPIPAIHEDEEEDKVSKSIKIYAQQDRDNWSIEEESSKNKDDATSKQSLADKNLQSSEEEIGNSNDSKNTEGQEPKHSLFNKDSEPPEKEKVDSKGSLSEYKDTLSSLVRERNKSIRLRKKGSLFYKYPQNSLNSMIEASNQGSRPNHELRSGSPPPQLLNRSHEIGECTINPSLLVKPSPCEERSMDNKGEWFNPSRISDIVAPSIQSGAIDGTIDGLKSIPSARKVGRVVSFIEGNGTKGMTTTAAIVAKEAFKGGVMSAVTSAVVESVVGETGAIGNIVKSGGSAAISAAVITGGNPVAVGVAAGSSMAITTVIEHTKQELAADKSFVEALSNSNMSNKQISEHLTTAEEISGYREAMTKKSEEESKSKKSQ